MDATQKTKIAFIGGSPVLIVSMPPASDREIMMQVECHWRTCDRLTLRPVLRQNLVFG